MTKPTNDVKADTGTPSNNAIVVGVLLNNEELETLQDDLTELEALITTLGYIPKGRIIQRRSRLVPSSLLGSGKIDEIKASVLELGAKVVIFDRPLSPPQVRNIEETVNCKVMDRTGVILEIFAKHAKTNAAKTQVEIAQLEYMLPRLSGAWTHFQRQRGDATQRGMGEKQIEIDRRRARDRIGRLKKQLDQIANEKMTQRKSRRRELKVAIVGYTNSGKTTIMNALTNAQLVAKDALFATLDASIRTLDPTTRPKILISDTVGFIRNLPHPLVASFKSTLDEVLEADLLIHVVDIAHKNYKLQMKITEEVLAEIGAAEIPVILVFNKIDALDEPRLGKILSQAYKGSISISAFKDEDIHRLREYIYKFFAANFVRAKLSIAPSNTTVLSILFQHCLVLDTDYSDEKAAIFDVQATPATLAKLKPYVIQESPISSSESGNEK